MSETNIRYASEKEFMHICLVLLMKVINMCIGSCLSNWKYSCVSIF